MNLSIASQILKYGPIGLGLLLAVLAFRLLKQEQSQKSPRKSMLRAILFFMAFSLTLCLVGLAQIVLEQRVNPAPEHYEVWDVAGTVQYERSIAIDRRSFGFLAEPPSPTWDSEGNFSLKVLRDARSREFPRLTVFPDQKLTSKYRQVTVTLGSSEADAIDRKTRTVKIGRKIVLKEEREPYSERETLTPISDSQRDEPR